MSSKQFILTLALVLVTAVLTAVVQGRMSHRWGTSDAVVKAAARLQQFPTDLGDWHMISTTPLDDDSRKQLQSIGDFMRVYRNAKTGACVTLLLILGPMGQTAAHTPEICMDAREFEPLGESSPVAVENAKNDHFWNKRYKARDLHGESVSVYWAWLDDKGDWIAPADARYAFGGQPYLYKAQVTCSFQGSFEVKNNDAGPAFLENFVPVAANFCAKKIEY